MMIKIAFTICTAAVLAAVVSALPAPPVEARTPKAEPATKIETQSSPCAQRAWPYYGQDCVIDFDARWGGEPRKVRLITTDRLN
jgi:hypothetical protein